MSVVAKRLDGSRCHLVRKADNVQAKYKEHTDFDMTWTKFDLR